MMLAQRPAPVDRELFGREIDRELASVAARELGRRGCVWFDPRGFSCDRRMYRRRLARYLLLPLEDQAGLRTAFEGSPESGVRCLDRLHVEVRLKSEAELRGVRHRSVLRPTALDWLAYDFGLLA